MVDIKTWMAELAAELTQQFGPRLLFLGVQGSYGRGEANEDSDIDVVTVLDRVELADLDAYRAAVRDMPEGEKACGFLCGRVELNSWPKFDLLAVARDTQDVYGHLADLLPPMDRADLAEAVSIGASGLYHAACHTYLYGAPEDWPEFLKKAHKSAFFVLRDLVELRIGENVRTKQELLLRLTGDERDILTYSLAQEGKPETAFARLLGWASAAMVEAHKISLT